MSPLWTHDDVAADGSHQRHQSHDNANNLDVRPVEFRHDVPPHFSSMPTY